jgi:hypothetical protein
VVSHLRKEDLLVDRVSPQLVRDKVVGADTSKPLAEVVDAFYKYPSLPMVVSPRVVLEAIQRGVQEGLFAVQIGERVYFKEPVSLERGRIRRDGAHRLHAACCGAARADRAHTWRCDAYARARHRERRRAAPPTRCVRLRVDACAPRYRRYALRARFSTDKFSEVFSSVIKPLLDESGRSFTFTIEFEVDGELPKQVVDMRVSESARQLGQVEREEKAVSDGRAATRRGRCCIPAATLNLSEVIEAGALRWTWDSGCLSRAVGVETRVKIYRRNPHD